MQKKTISYLSKLAVPIQSKGRFFKEAKTTLRNDFQRDRDRIIHSTAFRRLKHKTQVFVNTSGDHFRTRITHSLEVSQIARTLAKFFNLNEDLSETLSLAHDLGHTPFGHAGEESLNNCWCAPMCVGARQGSPEVAPKSSFNKFPQKISPPPKQNKHNFVPHKLKIRKNY